MPLSSSPSPARSMAGHLIRRLHQISTQIFADEMATAGFDITSVQFATLDAIGLKPGLDQSSLADLIAKDRVTVGAVVDRLERKGLIIRMINPQDKRARHLELSPQGQAVLMQTRPIVSRLQRDILAGLSETEYDLFLDLAHKAMQSAKS